MSENDKNINYYDLSAKYLSGEASKAEVEQLEQWVLSSADNKAHFQQFKKAWIWSGVGGNYQKIDVQKEWTAISGQLFGGAKVVPMQAKSGRRLSVMLSVAAAVVLLIVASVWLFQYLDGNKAVEVITENQVEEDRLPDGTQVALNQFSALTFEEQPERNVRKVKLTGDAFFEVEHDTTRPFLVTTENVSIEVLGTDFYVDARANQPRIEVIVQSGEVAVTAGAQRVVLGPDEKGVYDKATSSLTKRKNEDNNYLAWKTDILTFNAAKLEKVVFDLNRRFHAQISLADPALGNCEITATYEGQSLEAIVRIIEQTLNITANIEGEEVVFSGACE